MEEQGQNRLIGFFATLPSVLLAVFAPIIARLGITPALLPALRAAETPVLERVQASIPALVRAAIVETHAERSVRAIQEDLAGKLTALTYRITRFSDDVYQAVVADAAMDQVAGRLTPAQAQHAAYDRLTREGITGFRDSQGRNWELSAYVDMAVRTAAQRAYNAAILERLQQAGYQYFLVSDDGRPCPLCQPWEGTVLTDGVPDQVAQHTIAEATAAGLFHPRCKHILTGYRAGDPVPPKHTWGPDDQARYDQSQRQRALERRIRAAKREQAGAYTPEMKATAGRKVRQAQQAMRDFIDSTGAVRNPRREQLHL